ncbi:hypothetical protein HBZC1_09400 [Helicobacter bizzozeronii CIII-1]|uniref:Lipoprotein n=2 Tax=Helicobacter bizzozeronii TaxID=56877 RepID=F8KSZ2_HELBC|nr:hypothetical protein [Helicobacter bizzozeronii]CCB79926.1 hypothetical protein HBZC1_09400 [Helicobacter bizzozeronii CIII-1]
MKARQVILLGMFSSVVLFGACSVYENAESSKKPPASKHAEEKKELEKPKEHPKPPKPKEPTSTPPPPPKPKPTPPPPKPETTQAPNNQVIVINSSRFLMGYGVADIKSTANDDLDDKEDAYFNARRMLTFSIYKKFSQVLDKYHLKSDNLKNILLFSIDKAIDSMDIYKEKKYVVLPRYRKVLALFLVDSSVLERIRQTVRAQYNFTNEQRNVIDRLIFTMQNEDTLH